jgi:spermidine synthase
VFTLDAATRRLVQILDLPPETRERYLKYDPLTATVFLVTLVGASGFQLLPPVTFAAVIACPGLKAVLLYSVMPPGERARVFSSLGWLAFLFLISGVAALIYQIVWQRVLFAAFGINIESITIVVSIFMFGLGLGSILGGLVARKYPGKLIGLFVTCEMCVGLFGIVSLPLIAAVSGITLHGSLLVVSVAVFALLCIPTLLMGATLPILVSHLFQRYKNLGKTVGLLYCINTLGSAIACFLTADVLFVLLGEQASVMVAVACNWAVAALVIQYARRTRRAAIEQATAADGGAPYGGNSQSLPGRE